LSPYWTSEEESVEDAFAPNDNGDAVVATPRTAPTTMTSLPLMAEESSKV
jgi:hypothetical protein